MNESYINGLSPKNLVWSKGVIWGVKMIHLHDSDLLQGSFLFGSIKGVKRYKKIILIILVKSSDSNRLLWAHKFKHPSNAVIDSLMYPELFGQTCSYIEPTKVPPWLPQSE